MVRHGLPITVVVMNNARWGASQGFQMRPDGRRPRRGHRALRRRLPPGDDRLRRDAAHGSTRSKTSSSELEAAVQSGVATCINVSTNTVGLAPEIPQLNGP